MRPSLLVGSSEILWVPREAALELRVQGLQTEVAGRGVSKGPCSLLPIVSIVVPFFG